MSKRKWTLFQFTTGDFKAVERYLNQQAEKGWELEKLGACLARWKRTERTDLSWCVDLANPKENNDRATRKEYVDLCAEGGWELFSLRGNMYLFKSMPGRNPPPVQTDPELERKNYNKYYVRSTILSVVCVLAMLALYALMFLSMNRNLNYTIQSTRLEWHRHWLAVGTLGALPLWGVWALWRVADFIRAMVSNRDGGIGTPPRWVMWANCVVSLLGGLGAFLFLLGFGLEGVIQADFAVSVFVLPAAWAVTLLITAFLREFELYRGERRFTFRLGLMVLAVFIAMVVGRVAAPYGEWTTNPFSSSEPDVEEYALLADAPVVRAEDMGISLDEKSDYLMMTYEMTPVGERWETENHHWDLERKQSGCETVSCFTVWMAKLTEAQFLNEIAWWSEDANREGTASYLVMYAPPKVEMEEISLTWADSAWYGETEAASVLVVRIGKQVSCITAPMRLTEELLSAMESRLVG